MNGYPNCSANHTKIWSHYLVLALGIPQLTINIASVIFNCTVIFTRMATKDLHKPISILFCNLAFSDLFTSFSGFWISMLFITNPDITIFGSKDMLAPYALYTMSILSTIYNLVSIGIERYLAVAESMRTRFRVARNHSIAAVLINWVLALFLGCLPLMGWNCLRTEKNLSILYSPFCVDYLIFIAIPNVVVAFIIPLFTYLRIIIILRKRKLRMKACGQATGTYKSAEIQVARTSIFIWLLALISYAPFFAGVIFDATNHQCHADLYPGVYIFRNCTAMLITMNCLGNPIIYTLKPKALGAKLKPLKCLSASVSEPAPLRTSSRGCLWCRAADGPDPVNVVRGRAEITPHSRPLPARGQLRGAETNAGHGNQHGAAGGPRVGSRGRAAGVSWLLSAAFTAFGSG